MTLWTERLESKYESLFWCEHCAMSFNCELMCFFVLTDLFDLTCLKHFLSYISG